MKTSAKIISAALCAVALVGAAVPASAAPFRPGWGHPGWGERHDGWGRHGWGAGPALAIGGLGLATGAALASYHRPAVVTGPACGETVSTRYDAHGELAKVVRRNPC